MRNLRQTPSNSYGRSVEDNNLARQQSITIYYTITLQLTCTKRPKIPHVQRGPNRDAKKWLKIKSSDLLVTVRRKLRSNPQKSKQNHPKITWEIQRGSLIKTDALYVVDLTVQMQTFGNFKLCTQLVKCHYVQKS
jgi:hypothetical protein